MENNTLTVDKLLTICRENNYESLPSKNELAEVINIIKNIEGFGKYLKNTGFEDYELPYIVFGEIIDYILWCHKDGNQYMVEAMLIYLEKLSLSQDKDIQTLVVIGVIENLDQLGVELEKTYILLPANLKRIFDKHFSSYLKLSKRNKRILI